MFLIAYKHSSITTQGPARRYLENGRYFSNNTLQDEDVYYTLKLYILLLFYIILHQRIHLLFFTNSNHLYSSSILHYSSLFFAILRYSSLFFTILHQLQSSLFFFNSSLFFTNTTSFILHFSSLFFTITILLYSSTFNQ